MPSFTSILSLAALAALARAITVTKPEKNTLWDSSETNTVTWTSGPTDPKTADIYLSHMASQPPLNSLLFSNYDISKGSVQVKGLQLPTGEAYQINLVAHEKPEQIYAQSQQFNVTGEAVQATSTLDGYTGPTYSPTTGKDSSKTTLVQSTTTPASNGTATTTGSSATSTETDAGTSPSETESGSGSQSGSSTGTASNSTSTPIPANAAMGSFVASVPLAALVFGVVALFV